MEWRTLVTNKTADAAVELVRRLRLAVGRWQKSRLPYRGRAFAGEEGAVLESWLPAISCL